MLVNLKSRRFLLFAPRKYLIMWKLLSTKQREKVRVFTNTLLYECLWLMPTGCSRPVSFVLWALGITDIFIYETPEMLNPLVRRLCSSQFKSHCLLAALGRQDIISDCNGFGVFIVLAPVFYVVGWHSQYLSCFPGLLFPPRLFIFASSVSVTHAFISCLTGLIFLVSLCWFYCLLMCLWTSYC